MGEFLEVSLIVFQFTGDPEQALMSQNWGLYAWIMLVSSLVALPIVAPLRMGLNMLGVRRAAGSDLDISDLFAYFGQVWRIALLIVVMMALIYLGLILFVLPGIYLGVAYAFALYLLVDHKKGIWQALETSRRSVTHQWFKFLGFFLMLGLLNIVGAMCLLIGLIWTLPMTYIALGIVYREVFGTRVLEENLA